MNIEEIKERKHKLERDVRFLLNEFSEETKCDIHDLFVDKYPALGMSTSYIIKVRIEL